MKNILLCCMIAAVIVQRSLELRVAERNRQIALQRGALEFGAEHYPLFIVLHTAWILAWGIEGWFSQTPIFGDSLALFFAFVLAQGLRYWAISSLGDSWNTRILVVPNAERVRRGPYKWINHPNYVAVAIELACGPLIFGAWRTALAASLLNAMILFFIRIPAENKAMKEYLRG